MSKASKSAMKAVEEKGGAISCVYYNRLGLRALTRPHCFDILPKQALPIRKKDIGNQILLMEIIAWYSNAENRGYLSNINSANS